MISSYEADDYTVKKPVIFRRDTDIFDAIHELLANKVSGGTVLNEENEVVGVLSEMDCLKAIINTGYYSQGGGTVGDFMTSGPIEYMEPNLSVIDAAQKFIKTGRRRMPCVKDGKFVGQLSARSLLQAFKDSVTHHEATESE